MRENQSSPGPVQNALYWLGVVAALACMFLIFASNTDMAWRLEHTSVPASWIAGLIGILAFLGAEFCGSRPAGRPVNELTFETAQQEL